MWSLGGEFGAYMNVHIDNDGPVTLDIESPSFPPPKDVSHVKIITNFQCMQHFCSVYYTNADSFAKQAGSGIHLQLTIPL